MVTRHISKHVIKYTQTTLTLPHYNETRYNNIHTTISFTVINKTSYYTSLLTIHSNNIFKLLAIYGDNKQQQNVANKTHTL